MQVFKLFFKIAKSKLPSGMIYVIVFLAVCFPISKLGAEQTSFEQTSLDIVIFDEDNTVESKSLTECIGKNNEIKDVKNDPQLILDAMYYEQVDYALTIKKGYAEKLAKSDDESSRDALFETYHLHDSYETAMMEQYLDEYVRMVRAYVTGGNTLPEAIKKAEEKIDVETDVSIAEFKNSSATDENYTERFAFVFRYMPYALISVMINVLCPILLVIRKKEQRYRMNCSSTKMSSFTGQIFAGSSLLVFGIWLICIIGSAFIYGGIFKGINCWIAVGNTFLFALISAMIAILVSSFNPSENVVNMITQAIGLGMCFLCGVFVPQSLMSDSVMSAAKFLPAYWYEKANDILSGAASGSMGDVGICILIEVGFLVVLSLVTILVSRQRPAGKPVKLSAKPVA